MHPSILVHIVTWNSEKYIKKCVDSLFDQEGVVLDIAVTDNASHDSTVEYIKDDNVSLWINRENLGFCAAHNQCVERFLKTNHKYLLILNPDVVLDSFAIKNMIDASVDTGADLVTPKLIRANDDLSPSNPLVLDAAGMILTASLRHFDRGSNQSDRYNQREVVFGGTGACLLLTRKAVESLLLPAEIDDSLVKVFPQYKDLPLNRKQLFDEAFFAYREDADLSWRAKLFGLKCVFEPGAIGYHRRVVLPSNRQDLSSELNGLSVRNRFLLQINNYFFSEGILNFLFGAIFRNLIVLIGVLTLERSSLPYLLDIRPLFSRSMRIRANNKN